MVIVWRWRGNIIRTALCWIVWHNVHSQQHTYMSSSYRSNRLGLSHWDPYAVRRSGRLELCYCNMVEWFWWDSSLISTTNWFPSVFWHCWFGHLACINRPRNDLLCVEWDVKPLHHSATPIRCLVVSTCLACKQCSLVTTLYWDRNVYIIIIIAVVTLCDYLERRLSFLVILLHSIIIIVTIKLPTVRDL